MVILSIVGMVSSYVILQSMKVYSRSVPSMTAAYQARTCILRMKREIRAMDATTTISALTSSTLSFEDSSNSTIAYALSGGEITRNGDAMAQGVSSLAFTYWKSDGSSASAAADVHMVEIDFTVENVDQPYRMQAAVFPRVLGHD